jgi:hypothetical protein
MIFVASQAAIQIFGTALMRASTQKINGVIRSRSDLAEVKNAIQTNLFLGIAIVFNGALMVGTSWWIIINTGDLMLRLFYIAVIAALQIVLWKICRPVEQRFKTLPVESLEPGLLAEYQDYVKQWNGFTIFLKEPKRAGQEDMTRK